MSQIRAVGLVVYTYGELEKSAETLWDWLQQVEEWSGEPFAEFLLAPRGRESRRVLRTTQRNLAGLYERLRSGEPWYLLALAWPKGGGKRFLPCQDLTCSLSLTPSPVGAQSAPASPPMWP
jgi:hypothetical protein